MLKELVESNIDERQETFGFVKKELLRNANAEETYLYDTLTEREDMKQEANHLVAEHDQINEIIEQLDDTDMKSPQWLNYANLLRRQVLMHLDQEEDKIFMLASKHLSEKELEVLGEDFASVN